MIVPWPTNLTFKNFRFVIEKDEDGWPPVESEGLWAVPVGDGLYRLDNIPWYALVVAAGDVFRAEADDDGILWAREKVLDSGNCTIRVIPSGDGPFKGDPDAVLDIFAALGAEGAGLDRTQVWPRSASRLERTSRLSRPA